MHAARFRLLIATLWIGSLWTIGYVVAPTLFASLTDRMLAGTIAGKLFRIEAWVSIACALAMIVSVKVAPDERHAKAERQVLWLALAMLACTLIGYFVLQPFMAALRAAVSPEGVMDAATKSQFGILHGASSAFYLIQSLLGVLLVWKLR